MRTIAGKLSALLAVGVAILGCGSISSQEISGQYCLSAAGLREVLVLDTNGTYRQQLDRGQATWRRVGEWRSRKENGPLPFSSETLVELKDPYLAFNEHGALRPQPVPAEGLVILRVRKSLGTVQLIVTDELPFHWRKSQTCP